jgi:hypothetical protein
MSLSRRNSLGDESLVCEQRKPRLEPIYYCATGVEFPAFEPCKDKKDQRDI